VSDHAQRAFSVADKVVSLAEDGLSVIDRTIAAWPAEFRAIIWDAVVGIAAQRAEASRMEHERARGASSSGGSSHTPASNSPADRGSENG
jgi:hypothetical protein